MLTEYKTWRIRDTALLVKIGVGTASEDLHLAENAELVKDCTSRNQGLKRIKK